MNDFLRKIIKISRTHRTWRQTMFEHILALWIANSWALWVILQRLSKSGKKLSINQAKLEIANSLIELGISMESRARKKGRASSMKLIGRWGTKSKCGTGLSHCEMDDRCRRKCNSCGAHEKVRNVRFTCAKCHQTLCFQCAKEH